MTRRRLTEDENSALAALRAASSRVQRRAAQLDTERADQEAAIAACIALGVPTTAIAEHSGLTRQTVSARARRSRQAATPTPPDDAANL